MTPQGEVYPICCVFDTQADAVLANERITAATRVQNATLGRWSTPEQRVTDGKWWFQQPDYLGHVMVLENDISYTLEEFCLDWRPIETC